MANGKLDRPASEKPEDRLWRRRRSGKFNLAFLSAFAFDQRQSNFAANKMCDATVEEQQKK